jgi:hypothetical protein
LGRFLAARIFDIVEMAPPNYPGLWQCLGMVVGLYGVLYASAAWQPEQAKLIIASDWPEKFLGQSVWL